MAETRARVHTPYSDDKEEVTLHVSFDKNMRAHGARVNVVYNFVL